MIRNRALTAALAVAVGVSCAAGSALAAPADEGTGRVSVTVGQDPAGLAALVTAVSDPKSPQYGHFLTPDHVRARFGTTDAQRASVAAWLTSTGLSVDHSDPFTVTAAGPMQDAKAAASAQIPSALTGVVRAVHLSGATPLIGQPLSALPSETEDSDTAQCSAYFGEKEATQFPGAYGKQHLGFAPCAYEPKQLRDAYGLTANGLTGKGATIGVLSTEVDLTAESDLDHWSLDHGVQTLKPGQFTAYVAENASEEILPESAMDVEAVHGMAPDAKIVYSVGNGKISGSALLDALNRIVTDRLADIVTTSYAEGYLPIEQSLVDSWQAVLQRAAVEGISVNASTGDIGDRAGIQYPGSDPLITTVGGTSLAIGAYGQYLFEMPWENDVTVFNKDLGSWDPAPPGTFDSGGTGGISSFPMPAYQADVVTGNIANGQPRRAVPDISAFGDWFLGFPIGRTVDVWHTGINGGTSLSSPLIAAMEAAVVQARGKPLGFANPAIYAQAGGTAFHDITATTTTGGVMATVNQGPHAKTQTILVTGGQCQENPTMTCGPGYDTTTGVGSPAPDFFRLLGTARH